MNVNTPTVRTKAPALRIGFFFQDDSLFICAMEPNDQKLIHGQTDAWQTQRLSPNLRRYRRLAPALC